MPYDFNTLVLVDAEEQEAGVLYPARIPFIKVKRYSIP